MTAKLIALYTKPDDPESFDTHYRDVHSPLADQIPGVQSWDVAKFVGSPDGGEPEYYQIAELRFADTDAINAAFASPEGQAAADDYAKIAPEGSKMFVAVVPD